MSWLDRPALKSAIRFAAVAGLSLALAGCLRPLYGQNSVVDNSGATVTTGTRAQLASVNVEGLEGRVGQKLRNDLIFRLYGGGAPGPAHYKLLINMAEPTPEPAVVDPFTERAEVVVVGIDVAYTLVRVDTGQAVLTGNAFGRANYTKTRERFAGVRAERDAQDRAARELAELVRIAVLQDIPRAPVR
jgi:LPS-assembly lipoprotein